MSTDEARRPRGELERLVMRALWDVGGPVTAKEVRELVPGPTPAHTTVLTALERLRVKGHVERVGDEQRDVRFAATSTEEEHVGRAMLERLAGTSDRSAALQHFAGRLTRSDVRALRTALERESER